MTPQKTKQNDTKPNAAKEPVTVTPSPAPIDPTPTPTPDPAPIPESTALATIAPSEITTAKPRPVNIETREQKLIRLATKRVVKACRYIRFVGNLSAYKPTDAQIDKMMEALGESCARVDARLRGTRKDDIKFDLAS